MPTTEEIAAQLVLLIRWEPGMADVDDYRVVVVDNDGFLLLVWPDGGTEWVEPRPGALPALADNTTMDVLWGQLRRRFAACGGDWWEHGAEVLLAGYRRVTELEKEQGDGS